MIRFNEELSKRTPPESYGWPLAEQRRVWEDVCRLFRAPRPDGVEVTDILVPGPGGAVPVRVYRPAGEGLRPGLVYGHGGGWVLGSLETHDDMCAELALAAGVVVAAVDYRLAPEHPHPAQVEDALATLAYLRKEGDAHGIDPARILGGGDSAGGQITAGAALALRDRGLASWAGQLLIYPVLGVDTDTRSYRVNAEAPCLNRADMLYYIGAFAGPEGSPARADPTAFPLLAADLGGLPPAFISVAAHDPLHDDGVAFHERLRAAGVASELRVEPALAHSYMRARHHSAAAMAGFRAIADGLRRLAYGEGTAPG
jgi:acetyl esterase